MGASFPFEKLISIIEAEIIVNGELLPDRISTVFGSDLMSDILSHSKPNSLLLTGLSNPQTIRTAEMVEIAAICFIHDKNPQEETIDLAKKNELPLLKTRFSMYEACGKLFAAGLTD